MAGRTLTELRAEKAEESASAASSEAGEFHARAGLERAMLLLPERGGVEAWGQHGLGSATHARNVQVRGGGGEDERGRG